MSYEGYKIWVLVKFSLSGFKLCTFCILFKKSLPNPWPWRFSLVLFFESFIAFILTFKCMIHHELTFANLWGELNFIVLGVAVGFTWNILEERLSSPCWLSSAPLLRSPDCRLCPLSTCMSLCQYHTVWLRQLYSRSSDPVALVLQQGFFFFFFFWAILGPFKFPVSSWILESACYFW